MLDFTPWEWAVPVGVGEWAELQLIFITQEVISERLNVYFLSKLECMTLYSSPHNAPLLDLATSGTHSTKNL